MRQERKKLSIVFWLSLGLGACGPDAIVVPAAIHNVKPPPPTSSCDFAAIATAIDHTDPKITENLGNMAELAAPFAIFATNVYRRPAQQFTTPDWVLFSTSNKDNRVANALDDPATGFYGEAYIQRRFGDPKPKIAIAFRGTDTGSAGIQDWLSGNFAFSQSQTQYHQALNYAREIHNEMPEATLYFTGHSLGGGLALHASYFVDNAGVFAFNTSPKVFAPKGVGVPDSYRFLINEEGDVLGGIRAFYGTQSDPIYGLSYAYDFSTRDDHNMYNLARGLLAVAGVRGDDEALRLMGANLLCSDAINALIGARETDLQTKIAAAEAELARLRAENAALREAKAGIELTPPEGGAAHRVPPAGDSDAMTTARGSDEDDLGEVTGTVGDNRVDNPTDEVDAG